MVPSMFSIEGALSHLSRDRGILCDCKTSRYLREGSFEALVNSWEHFFAFSVGDMFEINTVRREDWDFIKDKSGEFVSVLQCNNAPSSRTPRGHQFPAAFMMTVAGLDKHMVSSKQPLKYR